LAGHYGPSVQPGSYLGVNGSWCSGLSLARVCPSTIESPLRTRYHAYFRTDLSSTRRFKHSLAHPRLRSRGFVLLRCRRSAQQGLAFGQVRDKGASGPFKNWPRCMLFSRFAEKKSYAFSFQQERSGAMLGTIRIVVMHNVSAGEIVECVQATCAKTKCGRAGVFFNPPREEHQRSQTVPSTFS
jgi:hypothetical protein